MSDKERLQEIKRKAITFNQELREIDLEEHIDWLIEQAEKVEWYEKVLKQIARHELFTESYFCDLEANELIYKAQEVLEGEAK